MSLMASIERGVRQKPPRLLIYGTEGIGKSKTASEAPSPIFIPTEDGLNQIDCDSFPLATSLEQVLKALEALEAEQHDYQTVVVDTLDWLERMIWVQVCADRGVKNIEDIGYQKGYVFALDHWRKIVDGLDALRDRRGMCVVLLAHSKIEKFEDPESPAYDRYSPRLHKHATAMITEWVDGVLFATMKVHTTTEDGGFGQKRTIATRGATDRVLRCIGSPACVAKNRFNLPAEIPLSWHELMNHMAAGMEPGAAETPEENVNG
jgi:hypothetical protein